MFDIVTGIWLMWFGGYQASFIGKRELCKYPLLGKLVTPLESVLTGRDKKDSNEEMGRTERKDQPQSFATYALFPKRRHVRYDHVSLNSVVREQ